MPEISAYEAKNRFSELLRRVEKGECFVITRYGLPVAILKPVPSRRKRKMEEVIRDILEFGRRHSLGGLTIRALIEEGRT